MPGISSQQHYCIPSNNHANYYLTTLIMLLWNKTKLLRLPDWCFVHSLLKLASPVWRHLAGSLGPSPLLGSCHLDAATRHVSGGCAIQWGLAWMWPWCRSTAVGCCIGKFLGMRCWARSVSWCLLVTLLASPLTTTLIILKQYIFTNSSWCTVSKAAIWWSSVTASCWE